MPLGTINPPYAGGRYYAQAAVLDMFTAHQFNTQINTNGTGQLGLQLWNPPTSGRNLVLIDIGGMIVATSAATTALILAYGVGQTTAPTTQIAASTITSTVLGPSTIISGNVQLSLPQKLPVAVALNQGTFTNAPLLFYNLLHNTAAIGTTGEDPGFRIDLNGKFIIPPGSYVGICAEPSATAASAANLDLTWLEAPI